MLNFFFRTERVPLLLTEIPNPPETREDDATEAQAAREDVRRGQSVLVFDGVADLGLEEGVGGVEADAVDGVVLAGGVFELKHGPCAVAVVIGKMSCNICFNAVLQH